MKRRDIKALVNKAIRNSPYVDLIEKISLFGSYARGDETKTSDIDLLIYFNLSAHITLFDLVDIQDALEKCLEKKVDLVLSDSVSPYLKDEIFASAQPVYEK